MFAVTSIVNHPMWGLFCDNVQTADTGERAREIARKRLEHYAEVYGEDYPAEEKEDKRGLAFSGSNGDVDWDVFVKEITVE